MATVEIRLTGPVFDGRAERELEVMEDEIKDVVAQQALADVHQVLDAKIKNPTPYYETQIVTERAGSDRVVHDRGIIYGPWLEGVGSRNAATGFPGYHAFREATQSVERRVGDLADPIVTRTMGRLV